MAVPQQIVGLIERFEEQRESYRSGKYKEAQLRVLTDSEELAAAKTDHDKTVLQREIDTTDKRIDQLVYQLYSLTEDQIKIVEEVTNA
jgi:predicted  nucleic acid-binding Zn-ribbon protein